MNIPPLFSVLLANYNNGKYINDAIGSIINQSYQNWEIIVVDDCSTDNSLEILKKYDKIEKLHIYRNKENRKCGFTKRKCIEKSNGELFGFLDPDDMLTPDALYIMVQAHLANPDVSLIYSTHYECNEELEIQKTADFVGQLPENISICIAPHGQRISHFATFKRQFYNKTIGLDQTLKRAVDQDIYLKIEETGKVLFVNKPLYYYRRNPNGISSQNNALKVSYWYLKILNNTVKRRKKLNSKLKSITEAELNSMCRCYYEEKITQTKLKKNYYKVLILHFYRLKYYPFKEILRQFRHFLGGFFTNYFNKGKVHRS
jgi:glycosyltransferase involved in cell wall biosynthesis